MDDSRNLSALDPSRRRLLAGGAGLFTASALGSFVHPAWAQAKPLPQYVAWKVPENLIVHSPTTLETRRHALAANLITPEVDLYIRNLMSGQAADEAMRRTERALEVLSAAAGGK